jgi:hypothetical protein
MPKRALNPVLHAGTGPVAALCEVRVDCAHPPNELDGYYTFRRLTPEDDKPYTEACGHLQLQPDDPKRAGPIPGLSGTAVLAALIDWYGQQPEDRTARAVLPFLNAAMTAARDAWETAESTADYQKA